MSRRPSRQPRRSREKPRRLLAVAMIGVALAEIGKRDAVIGGDHRLRLEIERGEMAFDAFGERVDIGRLIVIGRDRAQRRLPAHALQRIEGRVVDARGGRGAVLRIKRKDEHAIAAGLLQGVQPLGDRRLAVAHRPFDDDALLGGKLGRELLRLRAREGPQRRFVLARDSRSSRRAFRSGSGGSSERRPAGWAARSDAAPR